MLRNKRLNLSLLLAAVLAIVFWTQSRVPALNEKAQMGLRTQFNEIAFDTLLPVAADQGLAERVLRSTANWAWTNWKGMTFGLLFAAAALLILSSLRRRSFNSNWLNTLFGAAAGAPLGVCVNCATPIAQGIYAAGARLETALATLLASPTLNVIVLTMSFTVLPLQIATAKLVGVLAMIALLPLLVGRFSDTAKAAAQAKPLPGTANVPDMLSHESYGAALRSTARDYLKYLWYITKLALPLMLLAGLLGAIVVEVVPFDLFAARPASIAMIVLAALVATLLPVPIAFDVIAVSALLAAGADTGLATAVLFALGIYSIYPALVIAREISARLSIAIGCSVAAIAIALALITQGLGAASVESERRIIAQGLNEDVTAAYAQAVIECDSLPESLHERCIAEQLDKFSPYISDQQLCAARPAGLDASRCSDLVTDRAIARAAIEARDPAACAPLQSTAARADCEFSIALQLAVDVHDVEQCDSLQNPTRVSDCRTQYVSSSLLFNPDDSVCRRLDGPELADCRMNARVYRLAETMDFDGCLDFRGDEQREFCRYVIASSMIGRQNDPSGCAQLRTASLIERCRSQVIAWQAQRQRLTEHCALASDPSIRTLCQLRVAGLRIDALLSNATLARQGDRAASAELRLPDDVPEPAAAPSLEWTPAQSVTASGGSLIEVRRSVLAPNARQGTSQFRQVSAAELGIANPWTFRVTDFFEPFIVGKGIASGDFNNDAWPDLVFASDSGIVIYQNTGGQFERAPAALGALGTENTFVVAFVDANNDELADIFAAGYGGANYLLLNNGGSFSNAELIKLPGKRRLTFAAGFADLNSDGRPDIVHGNWTSGVERLFSPDQSANEILYSENGGYRIVTPEEVIGESLSVLLSDLDSDGDTDLVIANDRIVPDMFYLNDGSGELQLIEQHSDFAPLTSMFTMSLDSADFNNDLIPDLFSTDMTFSRSSRENYCETITDADERTHCITLLDAYDGFQSGSALVCSELDGQDARRDCFTAFAIQAAKNQKDDAWCEQLADSSAAVLSLCQHLASAVPPEESIDQSEYIHQVQRNVLLIGTGSGFVENAESLGVDSSFWSWNGKAADLDNDGWQDIYVGNGFHFGDNFYEIQENRFFRNIAGTHFQERAADWGLNDPLNTPSYTYVDFDLDGDLDIVATGVLAAPRVFLNEEERHGAVLIRLRDQQGNSAAIGATLTIGYGGSQALQQRREIRLSGGFQSFDDPIAFFGLGEHAQADWLEIRWPDGEISRLDSPVAAAQLLEITRRAGF